MSCLNCLYCKSAEEIYSIPQDFMICTAEPYPYACTSDNKIPKEIAEKYICRHFKSKDYYNIKTIIG